MHRPPSPAWGGSGLRQFTPLWAAAHLPHMGGDYLAGPPRLTLNHGDPARRRLAETGLTADFPPCGGDARQGRGGCGPAARAPSSPRPVSGLAIGLGRRRSVVSPVSKGAMRSSGPPPGGLVRRGLRPRSPGRGRHPWSDPAVWLITKALPVRAPAGTVPPPRHPVHERASRGGHTASVRGSCGGGDRIVDIKAQSSAKSLVTKIYERG